MKATIYQKIRQMREEVIALDWKPDKKYSVKGNFVYYVSISKMRRNFAPLFANAGLDFSFNIVEIIDNEDFIRIKIEFIITDCDDGDKDICTLFADGPKYYTKSNGEKEHESKGIEIALSYGARMYFTNKFQIVDGIEADSEEYDADNLIQDELNGRAIPEEEPVIVIPKATPKVTLTAVPKTTVTPVTPVTPVQTNVTGHKPVVGTGKVTLWSKPTETPVEAVTEKAEVVETVENPVPETTVPEKTVSNVSDKEKVAADKAMNVIENAYKKGELIQESYERAKGMYENLDSQNVAILLSLKKDLEASLGKDVGM